MGDVHCCKQKRIMGWCLKTFLICVCKLLWPFVFWGRQLLYLASPKRSQHKQSLAKSKAIWNNIKIVEYGLESSAQLLLQVWLILPFLNTILNLDNNTRINMCLSGLVNFFTFEILPACYLEKALAKLLLTIFFLSLGISQTKKNPGQVLINTLPMFLSIFAQTVGRIVALTCLFLTDLLLGGYTVTGLFLVIHFFLVFLIKTLFEVKSLRAKIVALCQSQGWRKRIWKVMKFITSCLSSIIVMIHLRSSDREERHKKHPTFLSHSAFQVLVLLENILLVCLPYGALLPKCVPAISWTKVVGFVTVAWLVGAVAQGFHYKFSNPLSPVNGPRATSWWPLPARLSCLATLCWKREIQRIEVTGLCQLQSKNNR
jgi:hypothetical protein